MREEKRGGRGEMKGRGREEAVIGENMRTFKKYYLYKFATITTYYNYY